MAGKWVVASTAVTFGRAAQQPVDRLEEAGCEVRLNPYGRPLDAKEMAEFAGDADALILGNDNLPASVIKKLKKLKIIARYGVGFDGVDLAEARDRGIEVIVLDLATEIHLFREDRDLDLGPDRIGSDDRAAEHIVINDEVLVHAGELLLDVKANGIGHVDVLSGDLVFHCYPS